MKPRLMQFVRVVAIPIFIVPALYMASSAAATRNCTKVEKQNADKALWLNNRDKALSLMRHLPWGVPTPTQSGSSESLLVQRNYVINYSHEYLMPTWTAHRLDAKDLGAEDRVNCFRRAPRINAPFASLPSDYKEPLYDQGHLTPNGDMTKDLIPVINSFVMSNMAPQYCQFNRGVWQILESMTRFWVTTYSTVYVITGSIFDRNKDFRRMKSTNGRARVAIPTHFYKVLLRQDSDGKVNTLAFIIPHDQTDLTGQGAIDYLEQNLVSIDDIEKATGLNLFPDVATSNPNAERPVERARAAGLWDVNGLRARTLVDDRFRATASL